VAPTIRTRTYLLLSIGALFVFVGVMVIILVNSNMKKQALVEAESKARLMLDRNLATHTYFTKDLKPSLFKTIGPLQSTDYFDPIWMSSTYAVLKMEKYFHHFNSKPYFYKESAINARSPENEADEYERQFINDLSADVKLNQRSAVRFFEKQPFLTVIRRGESMEDSCLRCHSTPDRAPGDLVKRYGPEKSFNRHIGDVVEAISIRIPLEVAYENANRFSLHLSALLIGLLFMVFGALFLLIRGFILSPLTAVRDQAVLITESPERLGEDISPPKNKEMRDLVNAFNKMSVRLKESYQNLEEKIRARTAELESSRQELLVEADELNRAQVSLRESQERYHDIWEKAPVMMVSLDSQAQINFVSDRFCEELGYERSEVLGRRSFDFQTENSAHYARSIVFPAFMKTGLVIDAPLQLVKKSGDVIDVLLNVTAERDSQGSIVRSRSVFIDVTQRKRAENLLQESEERYKNLLEVAPVGIAVHSEGEIVFLNPTGVSLLGGETEEQLIGKPIIEIIHPDGLEKAQSRIKRMMAGERGLYPAEDVYLKLDGTSTNVEVMATPLQYECKRAVQVIFTDITERKKTEEQLRRSEENYLKLFQDAPLMYVITRNEQGIPFISDCNKLFLNSVGFAREEVIGKPLADFYSPESQARLLDGGGYARALAGEYVMGERQLLTRDGRLIQTFLYTMPETDYSGHVTGTRSMFVDVTAERKAEETQRRLATAIDQATEGVIITNTEGTIHYVNPAISRMTGYSKEELRGANPRILKSEEHDSIFYAQLWATIKSGKIWSGRFINRKKNGQLYYEDSTISPVKDTSGAIVNFVAVKRDITEHLELSKQLFQAQKMEAIGTLAGGVAHDFNNLLQAVLGYSELMLQRKKEEEPDYADLQKIYQAGKRGADLVKSLMTFSRKVDTKHVPVDLNQEITSVRSLLSRTIPKTININLHLKGNLESIEADPSQISQVLMNLGVNARDAMPDGGTLTIETTNIQMDEEYCKSHLEAKPGNYVVLTFSDTGQGMDKETLSHIFEPFFTTKEIGKGTGLGLATVYGIVKQHGGQIKCYSELGLGTTFTIYLPAIQVEQDSQAPTVETTIPRGTETVLLVDDEDDIRDLGATLISQFGYKVITANNGKEALEAFQREGNCISLIILDLIMPEMDGRKCLEEILRVNPNAKVIVASGHSESGSANNVMAAGARGFIQKPYNMRQLLTTIREILDID
jgi:PAS domain S-box-containing protein